MRPHESFERLVERADAAMYRAKNDGRNRVRAALDVSYSMHAHPHPIDR